MDPRTKTRTRTRIRKIWEIIQFGPRRTDFKVDWPTRTGLKLAKLLKPRSYPDQQKNWNLGLADQQKSGLPWIPDRYINLWFIKVTDGFPTYEQLCGVSVGMHQLFLMYFTVYAWSHCFLSQIFFIFRKNIQKN